MKKQKSKQKTPLALTRVVKRRRNDNVNKLAQKLHDIGVREAHRLNPYVTQYSWKELEPHIKGAHRAIAKYVISNYRS